MRKIPARFQLLSHEITVVFRDDLQKEHDCDGRWRPTENLIELQSGLSFSYTLATFWHEATHAIATHMGMDALNDDEQKIDRLGQGIAQILTSKRCK